MTNYITKGIGGFYYVKTETGIVECRARGIFRKRGITPVAGDQVVLSADRTTIDEILPRKNVFIRPPVANLDVLFIVASTTQPVPSTLILDELTAAAVYKDVQPVIVITKADLAAADALEKAYADSTIPLIRLDYDTGEGLDQIRARIAGNLCAFCGNSGVGKSTLLNALAPQLERQTGGISQKLGRGRHTTREVEIFEVCGGLLADTPGFASLDANKICRIPPEELQHAFPEFEPYFGQCRFTGCSHRSVGRGQAFGYTLSELPDHVRGSQPVKGVGTLMQDLTKRAVILSAMPVTPALSAYLQPGDTVVACDAGYRNAAVLGIQPDLIVGDFDSAPKPETTGDMIILPHVKDDTDTHYAAKWLCERGYRHIVMLGALGGKRMEHTFSNVSTALYLASNGVDVTLADEHSELHILCPGKPLTLQKKDWMYLSVFPLDGPLGGVSIHGVFYPLKDATLTPDYPLGISNEFTAPEAELCCQSGHGLVILTRADG